MLVCNSIQLIFFILFVYSLMIKNNDFKNISEYEDIEDTQISENKKIPQRDESCVNEKDSINWLAYSLFLKSVNILL